MDAIEEALQTVIGLIVTERKREERPGQQHLLNRLQGILLDYKIKRDPIILRDSLAWVNRFIDDNQSFGYKEVWDFYKKMDLLYALLPE